MISQSFDAIADEQTGAIIQVIRPCLLLDGGREIPISGCFRTSVQRSSAATAMLWPHFPALMAYTLLGVVM
jgi:hypothetical protein